MTFQAAVDDVMAVEMEERERMDEKDEKKPRVQEGLALEVDIIKKMGHQLSRLKPADIERGAGERIIEFVASAVRSEKLKVLSTMNGAGQPSFPFPEPK